MKTILGIGAHYDDCVFGISGLLLKALRQHHRVVVLSLIGDYRNWKPVQGREREMVDGTVRIGKEYGVEMRFLDFAEMKFDVTEAATRLVADAGGRHRARCRLHALAARPASRPRARLRAGEGGTGLRRPVDRSRQALQAPPAGLPVRQRPSPHASASSPTRLWMSPTSGRSRWSGWAS